MHVNIFYESFEDHIITTSATVTYKIVYPRAEYPLKTEAMMKLNDSFLAGALSERSFVRNSLCGYTQKNNRNTDRKKEISYFSLSKCEYANHMFMSFTAETSVMVYANTVRYSLNSRTCRISNAENIPLHKLFRSADILPLLWELTNKHNAGMDCGYEDFAARFRPENYYLGSRGLYLFFPPENSLKDDYTRCIIPRCDIKKNLAYELW